MIFSNYDFIGIGCSKCHSLIPSVKLILPYFPHVLISLAKFSEEVTCDNLLAITVLLISAQWNTYLGINEFTTASQMKTLNICYLLIYWKRKVHSDFIFLCSLHYVLFNTLLRGDFPSRWLQLLQWPLVSLLVVPDRVEESLLQN